MRQLEVIRLSALGHTQEEIGHEMALSKKTVERHACDLRLLLGARNMSHAIVISIASGYLELGDDGVPQIAQYGEILLTA